MKEAISTLFGRLKTPLRVSLFTILHLSSIAQITPDSITIVRDEWGVPHIFAKTDAEVAYGLAWATAEDDFKTMQEQTLPIRGLAGLVSGKRGAFFDVAVHLLDVHDIVEERYETDLTPEFRKIVEAYAAGANAYAEAHPKEVLHKKLFPLSGKDIIKGYVVGMALMSNVDKPLQDILSGKYKSTQDIAASGSNAFAVSKKRTADGKTYLALNSHQPLEGLNSWYEAHLCSEEGWNILGANFAGGVSIFVGTNANLGWGHTLNYADFADVYELEMHPEKEHWYSFDGQWEQLQAFDTKARIKILGFLKVGSKQKFFKSKYGVTMKTDNGYFALRFPANRDIRAAEQWYRMNKARNFEEFKAALEMQAIICTNIVYADREDNIFYISNGRFPKRAPHYNWRGAVPGNTSATLWEDDYFPLDSLAQVFNPPSGYVYNANHTPFLSSGPADNPDTSLIPKTMGYQEIDRLTNRGVRLGELLEADQQISYEEFKAIKYDRSYHAPLRSSIKLEPIFALDANQYPQIAESIRLLNNWDRVADEDSKAASVFILAYRNLRRAINRQSFRQGDALTEEKMVAAIAAAQEHMQEHFGQPQVPLGELQRHSRGSVDLPYGGGPDVLAAVSSTMQKDGRLRARAGDSYIELVRYSKDGVEIESINAYGASAKEGSPHYTDQMELFTKQKLKKMTLNRSEIFKNAKRIYHPG